LIQKKTGLLYGTRPLTQKGNWIKSILFPPGLRQTVVG